MSIIKADQVNVVSDKVKLTKEQKVEEELLSELKFIQEKMAFSSDDIDVLFWNGRYSGMLKALYIIGMKVKGINS